MQSHIVDLQCVLSRLQAAGFILRGSKCSFGHSSVSHLGFKYSSSRVSSESDKTQAIINWPITASAKEVRSFLGLANSVVSSLHTTVRRCCSSLLHDLLDHGPLLCGNRPSRQPLMHYDKLWFLHQYLDTPVW